MGETSSMDDTPKQKAVADLSAYERWELPTIKGRSVSSGGATKSVPKRVKPLTAQDIERIRQAAFKDGFKEGKVKGFEQGRKEGQLAGKAAGHAEGLALGEAEGKSKVDLAVSQLTTLMQQLSDPISLQQQQVEQAVLNVALALSRSVIHRELIMDSSIVAQVVKQVLSSLPKTADGIRIKVSNTDFPYVQKTLKALNSEAELLSSPTIRSGGCVVETSSQQIDYTVEKRFQKVVHEMLLKASQDEKTPIAQESPDTIQELSDFPTSVLNEAEQDFDREANDQKSGDQKAIDDELTGHAEKNIPDAEAPLGEATPPEDVSDADTD